MRFSLRLLILAVITDRLLMLSAKLRLPTKVTPILDLILVLMTALLQLLNYVLNSVLNQLK